MRLFASEGRIFHKADKLRWRDWPLSLKLTVTMTILVITAVAALTFTSIYREQMVAQSEMEEQATLILNSLSVAASDALYFTNTNKLSDIAQRLRDTPNLLFARFYDSEGRLIGDSYDPAVAQRFDSDPLGRQLIQSDTAVFDWGNHYLIAGQSIALGRKPIGAISIGLSTAPLDARVAAIRMQGLGLALVAALTGMVLALIISRSITKPIERLAAATHRIGRGEFEFAAGVRREDEIGVLTRSFVDMTSRLSQSRQNLEQRTVELSRANEELRLTTVSKDFVDNIMASMVDTLIVASPDGVIRNANPAACKLLGYSEEELVGVHLSRIMVHEGEFHALGTGNSSKTEAISGGERTYRSKDGQLTPVSFSSSAMRNVGGEIEGIVCVARDITEWKRAEEALKEAREAALAGSRAKSEFLATMSHEIRTPLNAIMGMADVLSDTTLTLEQQQYISVFKASGDTLLAIINDILDLSKVESGQLSLEETDFDLVALVEDATQMMAFRAHDKGVELCCHIAPDVPTTLVGDPVRLRQVIINLLGNAIKFTPEGEVVLHVEQAPQADGAGCLLFRVCDTGIGIPPEKQGAIFDSFIQADSSTTRQYGGTGLGLAISRRLVELMQGRIWVESEIGRGSTFYFTARFGVKSPLPALANGGGEFQTIPAEGFKFPAGEWGRGLKTLVLDDNATCRKVLQGLLASWGVPATAAADCRQGLAEIKRARKADDPYRLVLLDSQLGDAEGTDVARVISGEMGSAGQIVMMLTTNNRSREVSRGQELGIHRYLMKPVKQKELLRAITTMPGDGEVFEGGAEKAETIVLQGPRPLRILLAEDYKNNRLVIETYLKDLDCDLDIAENGEVAVEKARSGSYDLVLMDIQMPVMDGYSATRAIRQWEYEQGLAPTPIIALTANALNEDVQRSLEAGCTSHLAKPLRKAELMNAILENTGAWKHESDQ